ncbi:MAG: alpha/beta hydrolase [bacterium]
MIAASRLHFSARIINRLSTVFLLGLITVMASACSTTPARPSAVVSDYKPPAKGGIEVFYATDRHGSSDASEIFNGERGEISFGVAQVGIPPRHKMGEHESPSLLKLETKPDPAKHILIRNIDSLETGDFVTLLRDAVDRSPGKQIMIFVHGYNVGFREGIRLLGQFAHDLKFEGPVVLFSWPSQGDLTGYTIDETNVQYATTHFSKLLKEMLEYTPAEDINLVAHSMGNRILVRGLLDLSREIPPKKLKLFKEVVMIAPDIDADVFRQGLAPKLQQTGIPLTLYASSSDNAILASKVVHGYPRLGDAGDHLVIIDGIDTIDASGAGGALGHSYFAEDRRIMADIFSLLQTGQRANRRFGLTPKTSRGRRYWALRE